MCLSLNKILFPKEARVLLIDVLQYQEADREESDHAVSLSSAPARSGWLGMWVCESKSNYIMSNAPNKDARRAREMIQTHLEL